MDLRKKLGEILDAASAGETILIERDHKPLAYLLSIEEGSRVIGTDDEQVQRQLEALDALVEIGKAWRRNHPTEPDDMTSAEWIRWDRDHRDDEKWERSFGEQARSERRGEDQG